VTATASAAAGAVNQAEAAAQIIADCEENGNPPGFPAEALTVQTDILTAVSTIGSGTATATASGTATAVANLNLVVSPPSPALPPPLVGTEIATATSTGSSTSTMTTRSNGNPFVGVAPYSVGSDIQARANLYPNNVAAPLSAESWAFINGNTGPGVLGPATYSSTATGEARAGSTVVGISLPPGLIGVITANSHARGTTTITGTGTGTGLAPTSGMNGFAGIGSYANSGDPFFGNPIITGILPALNMGGPLLGFNHDAFTAMGGIAAAADAGSSAAGGTNTARSTAMASGTTDATASCIAGLPIFNPGSDRASIDASGTASATVQNTNSGLLPAPAVPIPFVPGFPTDNSAQAGIGSVNIVGDELGAGGSIVPTSIAASGLGTMATADGTLGTSRLSSTATVSGANTHANGALGTTPGYDAFYAPGHVSLNSRSAASGAGSSQTVFNGIGQSEAMEGNGAVGVAAQNTVNALQLYLSGTAAADGWYTNILAGTGRAATSLAGTASSAHAGVTDSWVPASGVAVSSADSSIRNGALVPGGNALTGGEPGATSQFPQIGNTIGNVRWHYDIAYSYTTPNFFGVFN
jgi:hypothetical protein